MHISIMPSFLLKQDGPAYTRRNPDRRTTPSTPVGSSSDLARRKECRYAVEIHVAIEFEEEGGAQHIFHTKSIDLSAGGMRIGLKNLPPQLYWKLLPRKRRIVISAWLENPDTQVQLEGRIAWIQYQRRNPGSPGLGDYTLGLDFADADPNDLREYLALVNFWVSRTAEVDQVSEGGSPEPGG